MADHQVAADAPRYQCKSCKGNFLADGFYVSNPSKCKKCVCDQVKANRAANADYYRAYDRKRYREQPKRKIAARVSARSDAGKSAKERATQRSRRDEPEKWKARNKVSNAIRDGRIERGTECYFCGSSKRIQAHHEDYDHPLDVVWLCSTCHGKLHTIKGDFRRAK